MENPFETGHIKNYILMYVSVVVIMVLFFIASTLFHDVKSVEKKKFAQTQEGNNSLHKKRVVKNLFDINSSSFKMMKKSY
jgi:hypothetical protein